MEAERLFFSLCPSPLGGSMCPALSTGSAPALLGGGAVGYFHGAPKGKCPMGQAAAGGEGWLHPGRYRRGGQRRGTPRRAMEGPELVWFPVSALPSGEHRLSLGGSRSLL